MMDKMFQNDEKLPYLHWLTKIMFLANNKKMPQAEFEPGS